MANLKASSSCLAIAAAVNDPPPQRAEGVQLRLLYNPFEPESVEVHDLDWRAGATLADYFGDLPSEAQWMAFHNGIEIDLAKIEGVQVCEGDYLGLIVIPLGSNTVKSILRVVATAAMVVAALVLPPAWAAVAAVGIGLVSTFLLAPRSPKSNSTDEGTAYGIDGAKNSATENIVYPVVYGKFRYAGNLADCFTVNVGDDQYLYLRSVMNDGELASISDIEINEQPISSFTDVETRIALGTLDQDPNNWFSRSVVQQNKNVRITTDWTSHITTEEVDIIGLDISFPSGLSNVNEKSGNHEYKAVTFETRYRKLDPITKQPTSDWNGLPLGLGQPLTSPAELSAITVDRVLVTVERQLIYNSSGSILSPKIRYRPSNSAVWVDVPQVDLNYSSGSYLYDGSGDGSLSGSTNVTPSATYTYDLHLTPGTYVFEGVDNTAIKQITAYPTGGTSSATFGDSRLRAIRKTIESQQFDRGYYEVAIRRTTAPSTSDYTIDDAYLMDVSEIGTDTISLAGTANLSLKIRLNEQLNQIPTVTALVTGCVLQEYDIEGAPTVRRYSASPAWVALDIMMSEARGALMPAWRIDWPKWLAFADYCAKNSIEFNGVFDQKGNLGDALRQVTRIGHAAPVPFGTKYSVAIDQPRDPSAAFNSTHIIDGTFEVQYLSMSDRSNEYEVSYYDKTDRNKQKSLRYVDQKAVTFNEMPRQAQVDLAGVDNAQQALIELWRMIYSNRLIIRTVVFDTFLESITASIGDVVLVNHSMMKWSDDGRFEDGSTDTVLKLDRPVVVEDGADYSVIALFDALKVGSARAYLTVGRRLLIPHTTLTNPETALTLKRLTLESDQDQDYAILDVEQGAQYDTLLLDRAPTIPANATVNFWNTDALIERDVASVEVIDDKAVVHLKTAMPEAPKRLSAFIFGKKEELSRPYVLTGISGTGVEKRKLTMVEYYEEIYGPPEVELPVPVTRTSDSYVEHVNTLMLDYERFLPVGRNVVNVRLHWNPGKTVRYAGADIYMSLNGGAMQSIGTAVDAAEFTIQATPNDQVAFKVVAFNSKGYRAPISSAPMISGTLAVVYAYLDPPENFSATAIAFQVDGKVTMAWSPPANTTGVSGYELQYREVGQLTWTSAGLHTVTSVEITALTTGNYEARVRSTGSGDASSIWVYAIFTIVLVPGSLMANWLTSNDRNAEPIPTPTLPSTGVVEHTLNSDSSANLSFEWQWHGDEGTIDGFMVSVDREDAA